MTDSGGYPLLANLLSTALVQPDITTKVVAGGGTAPVTTGVKTEQSGAAVPIVEITATGESPYAVMQSVKLTTQYSNQALRNIQVAAGIPPGQMATTFTVADAFQPIGGMPSRTRKLIATLLIGVLLAVVLAVVVDAVLRAVGRRRTGSGRDADPKDGVASEDADGTHEAVDGPSAGIRST
ncbi:hypothetical protein [Gordonia hankookensis]|uniref:Uncharacterized protein n=1 Tax=Gordonia hankookensis TaxID=589403 RepID=A0ABR7W8W2_9ACTN|nr:hypothetical protein [Gordonia hankookensis]MBD1319035.1 hypothetical protein [Gordonia hankookensis]